VILEMLDEWEDKIFASFKNNRRIRMYQLDSKSNKIMLLFTYDHSEEIQKVLLLNNLLFIIQTNF
jgi:hypothetical protein